MSNAPSAALVELAHAHGIATQFGDWRGMQRQVGEQTIRAVLAGLGVAAQDDAQVRASQAELSGRAWSRTLPPVLVMTEGSRRPVPVHLPTGARFEAGLRLEDGTAQGLSNRPPKVPGRVVDGVEMAEFTVVLPSTLPLGWHTLVVTVGSQQHTMPLAVTPKKLQLPEPLRADQAQSWGLMTQLYAMRSARSWGLGDLADLADAGAWVAGLGADFVLVNPLHAAEPVAPLEPSPYLPTSRRFVNPLYIRVEDIREVAYLSAAQRQLVDRLGDDAKRYLATDLLERDPVWAAKEAALRLAFDHPRSARREGAFSLFCEREGQGLVDFATWCMLAVRHGNDFHQWEEQLQDPRSAAVQALRDARPGDIRFYCWLQWVLSEQLARVQRDLLDNGMSLGVMHDLAVGVHPDGADAWSLGGALARGVTVGAPADQYNQLGQDWSQPPWRPDRLAELGYAPYREMIRAVLRDAGGLRVDHVIGLFRLWWIPEGLAAKDGTYVSYDHDAMVGILMLEAHRAGAVVVGEDLGTVEPWVRDYLRERGILGTSILWFERDYDSASGTEEVLAPERYRELCLATVTTHDLPPTAGYLTGVHIELRHTLGLLDRPLEEEQAADAAYRGDVLEALRDRGLLGEHSSIEKQVEALHRFLAATPAKLLGVSVSDLAQDTRIINQPGTDEEYPNWRVPLAGPDGRPVLLDELFASDFARRLAETTNKKVSVSDAEKTIC